MTENLKKKRKSRKDNPYAALDVRLNLKTRHDEIADLASYANSLPKEAKDWLNAYSEEEIIGNRYHNGPKLNDFEDPKVRSRIYGKNNSRNRCIYTKEAAQGTMNYLEEIDVDKENEAYGEEHLENDFE